MKRVASLFLFFGLICLLLSSLLVWQRYSPQRLAFKGMKPSPSHFAQQQSPTQLIISDLGIDLQVYPARLKEKGWETTSLGVSFLTTSASPGNPGNSIIYGHNWPNLLGKLPMIIPGQEIQIVFSEGTYKRFRVEYTATVTPDQTHVLDNATDARLTLYTCTGFLDRKRFIVVAVPIDQAEALSRSDK